MNHIVQSAETSINPRHIDGPLLTFGDNQIQWLRIWEHAKFRRGLIDAALLQENLRLTTLRAREK